jgi:hypothetical protein
LTRRYTPFYLLYGREAHLPSVGHVMTCVADTPLVCSLFYAWSAAADHMSTRDAVEGH